LGRAADVIGRKDVGDRIARAPRPLEILRQDFRRDVQRLAAMPREHLSEQLLALAVAVGEGGVEEIAAERDGALERGQRLVVVRAGPAAHTPKAVADFGDRPSESAERTREHLVILAAGNSEFRVQNSEY